MMILSDVDQRLGGKLVLRGAEATFRPGEFWAVVGPNGAGKSTLLRTAAGVLRPERGEVTWQGRSVHGMTPRARAGHIAWVPQEMRIRDPFTVREVVRMGRYGRMYVPGADVTEDRRAIAKALAASGLMDLAERAVTTLSGGERQRVLIARALAQDPQCLLLDEPTASLDLGQADGILQVLSARARAGHVVVAVLHDLELASRVADGILLITEGRTVASGTPQEVLDSSVLTAAFRTPLHAVWDDEGARIRVCRPTTQ